MSADDHGKIDHAGVQYLKGLDIYEFFIEFTQYEKRTSKKLQNLKEKNNGKKG